MQTYHIGKRSLKEILAKSFGDAGRVAVEFTISADSCFENTSLVVFESGDKE